jgi:hypothetical protein
MTDRSEGTPADLEPGSLVAVADLPRLVPCGENWRVKWYQDQLGLPPSWHRVIGWVIMDNPRDPEGPPRIEAAFVFDGTIVVTDRYDGARCDIIHRDDARS